MDEQWNLFLLDSCFRKINQYRINWNSQKSLKQLLKNPQPEDTGLYEVEYTKNTPKRFLFQTCLSFQVNVYFI
jgi:hypothetical protein